MANNTAVFGIGLLVLGTAIYFATKKPAEAKDKEYIPKFKVGDHVISPTRLPTDVIYVVMAVDPSSGLYTLAQWFGGVVIPLAVSDYSIATTDANYVLA